MIWGKYDQGTLDTCVARSREELRGAIYTNRSSRK